jgi:UDP-N-acetylmuramoyl-tripeptide--D-alanyl-D-alanine ligase
MFELGDDAQRMHADVGGSIREAGIDRLFAHGEMSRLAAENFGEQAEWYDSLDALVDEVSGQLGDGVNVLVKGSRGMRMERVVEALRANGGT